MNKSQSTCFDNTLGKIESSIVEIDDRPNALSNQFGNHCLVFENEVYNWTTKLSKDYTGGYWEFYNLSNRGFYMAPKTEQTFHIINPMNGFSGHMSADAVGISVCCFALSHLSNIYQNDPVWVDCFYQLREFAIQHKEAISIMQLID